MEAPFASAARACSRRELLRRLGAATLAGFPRAASAGGTSTHSSLSRSDFTWLESTARALIQGCRVPARDGTQLFTPDGKGNYRALWTRDFAYMVENAGDLMGPAEVEAALRILLGGLRHDGATPDRVQPDGIAVYTGGPPDRPLGEPNLDNGPFLVLAIDAHLRRIASSKARACFQEWSPSLRRALAWIPRSAAGLVWNDPGRPHSPYGFTDTVGKTGELFFESLLDWEATRKLAALERRWGDRRQARDLRARAARIEDSIERLWDSEAGAFLAATHDCRQLDVWGNAFALWIRFPLGGRRAAVLRWLAEHHRDYLWRGQVRHLLRGQYWQRLLAPVEKERYQNGAYWATGSGWVLTALGEAAPEVAGQAWRELIQDFRSGGVCECINEGYRQLPSYVVSATNPLAAARRSRLF